MRHGHVNYMAKSVVGEKGMREVPLTRLGRDQASAAGQALAGVRFDLAISSGYPRTADTLNLVLAENREPIPVAEVEPDLAEIRNGAFPPIKGRRDISSAMAFSFDNAAAPGATMLPGGEVFSEGVVRRASAIQRLLARPDWHTALVVAHEGTNRLILGWMTGNDLSAITCFEQDLGAINILDFDLVPSSDGQGVTIERRIIKAVNLTPYNYVKHGMNLTSLEFIVEPYEDRPDDVAGVS